MINEKNGWGKSTLAAFIKVMFYGFANEKKRGDALEKERVRYKPWQGGVYGGELEFEAGGKRYLLNRTFGAKEAEDTFALYDAATNLSSEDFSRNIGEELFRINQESFLRTVYIAQNDCETATTDSINAKMGNLAESLDDINKYEKVQLVLKDLKNSLTPNRKTGELKKRKEQIDDLKNEIRRRDSVEKSIGELEERLEQCRKEKEEVRRRQEVLQEELLELGRQKELEAKKEHYGRILHQYEERQAAVRECEEFFGGRAPAKEELREAGDRRSAMLQREADMHANALSDGELDELERISGLFGAGVPEEELLEKGDRLAEQLAELRRQAETYRFSAEEEQEAELLRKRYGECGMGEEDIDPYLEQWNLYSQIGSGLGTKRATLSSLKMVEESARAAREREEREQESRRKQRRMLLLLPACLLLIGLGLCFLELFVGIALIVTSAAMAAVFLARGRREGDPSAKTDGLRGGNGVPGSGGNGAEEPAPESGAAALEREIADDEERMERAKEQVLRFVESFASGDGADGQNVRDTLYAMKNDLRRLGKFQARERDYREKGFESRMQSLVRELRDLLQPYCDARELEEGAWEELLRRIRSNKGIYLRLGAKRERYLEAEAGYADAQACLTAFLTEHGCGEVQDIDGHLSRMTEKLALYEKSLAELESCRKERREFEENNEIGAFEQAASAGARSMDEVKAGLQVLGEQLEDISENVNSYLAQLDDRQREAEDLEGKQEELAKLEEEYERRYRYYRALELTSDYLERAKESFSARYMGPIMEAFRHYYEMMSSLSGEDFRMDANISLTKREAGAMRDTKALSAGNRDLVGIALRMALIEAMYQKEKPFLIFDDPFVNLDDERAENAKRFLRRIAEKYQVIYFTCHGSRV